MNNYTAFPPKKKKIYAKDGIELYYEQWTRKESDTTLIFLHGLGGDAHAWFQEIPYFLSKGYSVIAPDLRGHGLSEHPSDTSGYKIEYFVSDLHEIVAEAHSEKIVFIGHCFGGMISLVFAKEHPEMVSKMILIDSSYRFPYIDSNNLANKVARQILQIGAHFVPSAYIKKHIESAKYSYTSDFNLIRIANDIAHLSIRGFMILYAEVMGFSAEDWLDKIQTPTLIIESVDDLVVPKYMAIALQQKIKDSHLILIPHGHHIALLNNPSDINRAIEGFLSEKSKR